MATLPISEKRDIQIGIVSAVVTLLLIFLMLLLLGFEVADPKPEPPKVEATSEIEEIVLENLKVDVGGGSEGAPSDDPVKEPTSQTEEVIASIKTSPKTTNSGKSNKTNSPKSTGEPTSTQQSNNPFGGGGSGNEGTGSGKFGNDAGGGSGDGPGGLGDGSGRTRLNDPRVDDIASDQNHTINLLVKINASGNIVSISNIAAKTTCTDQRILNKVMAAVKSQVKYSKKPDSGLELVYITVNLNAN
jgi:hypothetical protein